MSLFKRFKKAQKKKVYQEVCLTNVSQNTSEQINKNYLKDFFKTTLQNSNYTINSKSKVFFSYFKESNLYEIYFIENFYSNSYIEPFVFYELHNDKFIELFITEKYFTVFKNKNIILYKEIKNNIEENEILTFLKQRYKIDVDKTYHINLKELNEIKDKYLLNKKTPQLISLKKDKSIIYLVSFLCIIFLIPIVHYNFIYNKNKTTKTLDKKISILEKRYEAIINNKDKKKTSYLINTLVLIKNYRLNIKSILLKKNNFLLFLESSKKMNLIKFVDNYTGKIKINKLNFNPKNKKFDLEVSIAI